MTTADAATTPAAAAVPLSEDVGSKFLAAFATSLAAKVTETLAEQYAAAKAAEEKAAKDAAAEEEEDAKAAAEAAKEKEKSKGEKAAKHVRTEDMNTELYKIDAVCCPRPPFVEVAALIQAHRSATPIPATASSCPGTTPAPATPTTTTCPTSTASGSSSCAGCSATRTSCARPSSTSSRR